MTQPNQSELYDQLNELFLRGERLGRSLYVSDDERHDAVKNASRYITANYTPNKRTGKLALMASAYRDNGRNEFTQVTANCPCGRGGWIRLPKHLDIEALVAEQAILDWHNKEVEIVLDRLQHELDGGRTYTSVSLIEDTIQAERAKLKEAK